MNRTDPLYRTSARGQRGLTLVELMIAMTLGLLVLGIAATLFEGTSRGRTEIERSDRLAEGAQQAIELLGDDIRHAGYYAELNLTGFANSVADPCATKLADLGFATSPAAVPVPVRGFRPEDELPDCVEHRREGTAAFALWRLAVDPTPRAQASGAAFVQVSKCDKELPGEWRYSSTASDFTLRNIDCATLADIRRVVVRTYYVAACNECGRDTTPTLKRADLVDGKIVETPIAEGVENLQVEYGFDVDGDGIADKYAAGLSGEAGAADDDWSNVVAARVHVVARTTQADAKFSASATKQFDFGLAGSASAGGDAYKRTMLSSLVWMPNVAGKRERP